MPRDTPGMKAEAIDLSIAASGSKAIGIAVSEGWEPVARPAVARAVAHELLVGADVIEGTP